MWAQNDLKIRPAVYEMAAPGVRFLQAIRFNVPITYLALRIFFCSAIVILVAVNGEMSGAALPVRPKLSSWA